MLDTIENGLDGKQMFIMEGWNKHIDNTVVVVISYLALLLSLVGALEILKKKREYILHASLLLFVGSFILLGTNVPIAGTLNEVIRKYIPLFGEAFRFPFTKLVLVFVFSYSLLLVEGLEILGNIMNALVFPRLSSYPLHPLHHLRRRAPCLPLPNP